MEYRGSFICNCLIYPDQNRTALSGADDTPKICKGKFDLQIFFHKIKDFSKPLPDQGKYSLNWAPVVKPNGTGVCLSKVVVYYNGPTEKCCDGWMKSEPKFPRENNDSSPIILDLCHHCILDKCQKASRRVSVTMAIGKNE